MFIYQFIYLFICYLFNLFINLSLYLFYGYGKIKICVKKKWLLELFSCSLLFFQFYNKKIKLGGFVSYSSFGPSGVLIHTQKTGGVLAQGIAPSLHPASQGPWKFRGRRCCSLLGLITSEHVSHTLLMFSAAAVICVQQPLKQLCSHIIFNVLFLKMFYDGDNLKTRHLRRS